ncbi:MAG TPA: undecaprenyl-diphosphatase [Polaromonas sp.]|uniref:undecaprenyl-diphosphatase n=1 Tax=Polaromonas sp. UBA4122 TaxID=1947074 RepID=UPI000EDAB852|nr:undecaprenyl-diphosphatase [Polaromonas sp. UBA4122]HAL36675.1 undecaprenyl-diphosphatase [Polaromonas sp.]
MQELNEALFLLINAQDRPNAVLLAIAKIFANQVIWLAPLAVIVGWLRGSDRTRMLMLEATVSGLAGLLINQAIGMLWQHPRPFMVGLGNTFIPHAPDSSFPSDHLTLLWGIAFSFLMHQRPRFAGVVLALLGLPMAWARIYLGVHFPLDMVGAALVAGLSAYLCFREERWFMDTVYRWATAIYRRLFSMPIRLGWVRP